MISLEKWNILTSLQKLSKNVWYLDKLIVAKGFKKLPNLVTLLDTHIGRQSVTGYLLNGDGQIDILFCCQGVDFNLKNGWNYINLFY